MAGWSRDARNAPPRWPETDVTAAHAMISAAAATEKTALDGRIDSDLGL